MTDARHPAAGDDLRFALTRPPEEVTGELDYASTVTAPTEWVPYVYTESELRALARRRALSVASLWFGAVGLAGAVFVVWTAPLSLAAVVLAVWASRTERAAVSIWAWGLGTGLAGLVIAAGWIVLISQGISPVPH